MTEKILATMQRTLIGVTVIVQVFFFPAAALSQESDPSEVPPVETSEPAEETPEEPVEQPPEEEVAPPPPPPEEEEEEVQGPAGLTGPTEPPGPARSSYVLNPATGMYENDYYIWNPATGQTTPKQQRTYSYNPTTGMWDTTEWYYSPEAGRYLPNTRSVASPPAGAQLVSPSSAGPNGSISNTGPNSNNAIDFGGTTIGTFDLFFDATISNKIGQMTRSGDALVQGNTNAGSALTGDAASIANLLNILQSSWGQLGSDDISLFVANIDGDVVGDLLIDPSGIAAGSGNTDLDINVSSSAAIDNEIDVEVASGNAGVNGNTNAGDAESGDARAVVNLLNLINSAINANKSFVGVLNINGSLNGDILLPPGMLEAIIASTGPDSTNEINDDSTATIDVTIDNERTISNDVTTAASSGDALVSGNTNAGSAKTGKADTNVVFLNLTGKKVVAKNAMLVFVNVLGSWVGLIMDAPAGTYAVATTGPNSTNTINNTSNLDADVNIDSQSTITNDVNVSAASGDASVTHNTNAGDATSGDASVGVNILNMIDSSFSVDDWFGVLFINVFGEWLGSFGIDTEAGTVPLPLVNGAPEGVSVPEGGAPVAPGTATFTFVPGSRAAASAFVGSTTGPGPSATATTTTSVVKAATNAAKAGQANSSNIPDRSSLWASGIAVMTGLLLLAAERLIAFIRERQFA